MNDRTRSTIIDPAIANPSNGLLLKRQYSCVSSKGQTGECQNCSQSSAIHANQDATFARGQIVDHASPSVRSSTFFESDLGHDFSRISVKLDSPPTLQRKLTVNAPGDIYEQEADLVAERVMRMTVDKPTSPRPSVSARAESNANSAMRETAEDDEKKPLPLIVKTEADTKTDADKLRDAGEKAVERFLGTDTGKGILTRAQSAVLDGHSTAETIAVIVPAAVLGASFLAVTNSELPVQIPKIPLDFLIPGLKVQLKVVGHVRNPTEASLTFFYESKAKEDDKASTSSVRESNDKMRRDLDKFREGMKTPEERRAEKQEREAWLQAALNDPKNPMSLGGRLSRPTVGLSPAAKSTIDTQFPKKDSDDEATLQRKAVADGPVPDAPSIVRDVTQSSGQSLDSQSRAFFEPRFGHDFSHVKVHTDQRAAESAAAIHAKAYTVGNNIVFGRGEHPSRDRHLLAHELTHVIQQQGDIAKPRLGYQITTQPTIQRYEAGEHAMFGSDDIVSVNSVEFTHGELIAMGDFFESAEQMRAASADELRKLRDLIRQDRNAYSGTSNTKPVSTDQWQKAAGGRYLDLASRNDAHFAPPTGATGLGGTNHKAKFYELHTQAMYQAWFDGRLSGGKVSSAAIAKNSFAAHFLTDAFSAGHLVNKSEVVASAASSWQSTQTTGAYFKENLFTKAVAHRLVSDPRSAPKLAAYEMKLISWGGITEDRFSEFLWQVASTKPTLFFNAFARTVHDELNHSVDSDPANGVEVSVPGRAQPWRLSGDSTLASSRETLQAGKQAVDESERNLAIAAKSTSEPDFKSLCDSVWNMTPTPTEAGKKNIQAMARELTSVTSQRSIDRFIELTITEIDVTINQLVDMGYLRPRSTLSDGEAKEHNVHEHIRR